MRKPLTPARIRRLGAWWQSPRWARRLCPRSLAPTRSRLDYAASTAIVAVAKQPPPVAVLSFAMVQGAVYERSTAIDGRYRPYLVTPPAPPHATPRTRRPPPRRSGVLAGLFPAQRRRCRRVRRVAGRDPDRPASRAASPTASGPRRRCSPRGPTTADSARSRR